DRVTSLVKAIRPPIYVKGGDYSMESLNAEELTALREIGAAIHILTLVPGKSTTAILGKMGSTKAGRRGKNRSSATSARFPCGDLPQYGRVERVLSFLDARV